MKNQANATQFFYQNGKLITVSQGAQKRAIFAYDDVPLAELHTDLKASATRVFTDKSGSVLGMSSEVETAALAYAAYGHDAAKTRMLSLFSLLRFNGQYRTDEGHYLLGNGYRSYSPALMRFYSPDNVSPFQEGGLNSYCYCLGDPVNQSDPTGHFSLRHFSLFKPSTWISTRSSRIDKRKQQVSDRREKLMLDRSAVIQLTEEPTTIENLTAINKLQNQISTDAKYVKKKLKNLKKYGQAPTESTDQMAIRIRYLEYKKNNDQHINQMKIQSARNGSPMNLFNHREGKTDPDLYYRAEELRKAKI